MEYLPIRASAGAGLRGPGATRFHGSVDLPSPHPSSSPRTLQPVKQLLSRIIPPKGRDKDISPGNCPPSPQPTTPIHRHKQCSVSPRSGETHRRIVAVAIPNYEESIAAKTTLFDSKDTQIGNKLYHLRDHEHNLNGIHHVQFTNFFSTKETFNRSCPIVMNC